MNDNQYNLFDTPGNSNDSYLDELVERLKQEPSHWNMRILRQYTILYDSDDIEIKEATNLLQQAYKDKL